MAADVTVAPTLGHAVLMTQGGVGASPGYDAIDLRRMIQAALGGQEGVYDATGWKVREHTSGANMQVQLDANVGLARVDGESVTHQGPYIVAPHSAVITLDVTAAHSTNPRLDMVILHVRDNTHDALGANDARVRILAGTATSGATLDNLNGQASLPSNAIRLADVLVPNADTTISNSQIRDRRKWARGAKLVITRNANAAAGNDYTTTSTGAAAAIDTTNLSPRIECSGALLQMTLRSEWTHSVTGGGGIFVMHIDSVAVDGGAQANPKATGAGLNEPLNFEWETVPAAGSHVIRPAFASTTAGTTTLRAQAGIPMQWVVEEIIRPNASNS